MTASLGEVAFEGGKPTKSVHGDDFLFQSLHQEGCPFGEDTPQLLGGDGLQDASVGVLGGGAVLHVEKEGEPLVLSIDEIHDGGESLLPAGQADNRGKKDGLERMPKIAAAGARRFCRRPSGLEIKLLANLQPFPISDLLTGTSNAEALALLRRPAGMSDR